MPPAQYCLDWLNQTKISLPDGKKTWILLCWTALLCYFTVDCSRLNVCVFSQLWFDMFFLKLCLYRSVAKNIQCNSKWTTIALNSPRRLLPNPSLLNRHRIIRNIILSLRNFCQQVCLVCTPTTWSCFLCSYSSGSKRQFLPLLRC